MPRPNAAIYYALDAYDTSRPHLMGRHSAGEGFLRGFVRHGGADRLYCYARHAGDAQDFAKRVRPAKVSHFTRVEKGKTWIREAKDGEPALTVRPRRCATSSRRCVRTAQANGPASVPAADATQLPNRLCAASV